MSFPRTNASTITAWIGCVIYCSLTFLTPGLLIQESIATLLRQPGSMVEIWREARAIRVDGDHVSIHVGGDGGAIVDVVWPSNTVKVGDHVEVLVHVEEDGTLRAVDGMVRPYRWLKVLVSIPGAVIVGLLLLADYRITLKGLSPRKEP